MQKCVDYLGSMLLLLDVIYLKPSEDDNLMTEKCAVTTSLEIKPVRLYTFINLWVCSIIENILLIYILEDIPASQKSPPHPRGQWHRAAKVVSFTQRPLFRQTWSMQDTCVSHLWPVYSYSKNIIIILSVCQIITAHLELLKNVALYLQTCAVWHMMLV